MAEYNADIRLGVKGLGALKKLNDQLAVADKKLTSINKKLQFKNRTPTIKFNTKGAESAVKRLERQLNKLASKTKTVSSGFSSSAKGADKVTDAIKRSEKAQDRLNAAQKRGQALRRGAGAGAGLAAAGALSSVPVLGDAASGALAGGFTTGTLGGAAAGAAAAGIVAIGAAAISVTADVTKFANALELQRQALALTVKSAAEYSTALKVIDSVSDDFIVPISDATKQFTKLQAAAAGSGVSLSETEKVYRGLSAANLALGGNSESLNGILLATQQIFSKGKVQAEELRGQIGERLPGAFAKFAQATGRSTAELDKALEQGEVSLDDFIKFAAKLLEEYEEDAKKIADSPANAGARLQKSLEDLKLALAPILQDIGNNFLEFAKTVVDAMTDATNAIANLLGYSEEALKQQLKGVEKRLRQARLGGTPAYAENRARNQQGFSGGEVERLEAERNRLLALVNGFAGAGRRFGNPTPPKPNEGGGDKTSTKTSTPRNDTERAQELLRTITQQNEVFNTQGELEKELLRIEQARLNLLQQISKFEGVDPALITQLEQAIDLQTRQKSRDATLEATNELYGEIFDKVAATTGAAFDALRPLEEQKRILEGTLDGRGEEVRRLIDAENIVRSIEGLSAETREQVKGTVIARLEEIDALQKQADKTEQLKEMYKQLSSTIAGEITGGLKEIIKGTKSVEEAFGSMLEGIADAFLDFALKLLNDALVKQLATLISSLFGPNPNPAVPALPLNGNAEGGYVTGPTQALIGEAGEPEYVIPSSRVSSAMSRFSQGMRGEAVVAGASEYGSGESGGGSAGTSTIDVSYNVTEINGMSFITEEQFRQGLSKASNDGARMGEARALGRLKNSTSVRKGIGL